MEKSITYKQFVEKIEKLFIKIPIKWYIQQHFRKLA